MSDNIVQMDTIRIERNKTRKCTCDEYKKKFSVDTKNKEVTCGCGQIVDPYDAMEYLARHYEHLNERHKEMNEQRKQWIKEKPYSVLFKSLEQSYQRGRMLPHCPVCNYLIELDKLPSWSNAEFYLKRQKDILAAKAAIGTTEEDA